MNDTLVLGVGISISLFCLLFILYVLIVPVANRFTQWSPKMKNRNGVVTVQALALSAGRLLWSIIAFFLLSYFLGWIAVTFMR